jgi:hypothetical protein
MPAAAIPIIGAVAGAGGSAASASGGKKAQKKGNELAQQQLGLQQQQFGLTKQQVGLGNAALSPAAQYFQSLLQGGQAARVAVSPMAQLIGQAGQGANNAILAGTPRGGEQNLALAQNRIGTAGQIANLYTGVQPMAAQGLAGIGGEYLGSGSSMNPNSNIGAAQGQYGLSQQMAGQSGSGFGSLLYNSLQKLQKPSAGGGGGTPPFLPAGKG